MTKLLTCSQGHQWVLSEAAFSRAEDGPESCPVCGIVMAVERTGAAPDAAARAESLLAPTAVIRVKGPGADADLLLHRPEVPRPPSSFRPDVPGYEILEVLGQGGMGVVYKARQVGLGRLVALKMILAGPHADAESLVRFRTEAEAVARLIHPHIVQVFEIGQCDGRPFFAMEFLEGGSLSDHFHGTPQLIPDTAQLLELLARAVHHAHERGIVHRDLKPENVLLARRTGGLSCDPKITDFGLAKRLDDDTNLTQTGQILGTPSYMAPEQAQGKGAVTGPATDVYALGVLLYEALTGRPPFRGTSPLDTLQQVLTLDPIRPSRLRPRLPRDLETICLHCLEKDPLRRYPSAAALADDLSRFLRGEPIAARPTAAWERAWKWARRRPAIAALTGCLAVLCIVAFALVTWQWHRAEHALEETENARRKAVQTAEAEARARRDAQEFSSKLLLERGLGLCEAGEFGHGLHWLARGLKIAPDSAAELRRSLRTLLDGWGGQLHPQRLLLHERDAGYPVALRPDGKAVLLVRRKRAQVWDLTSGEPLGQAWQHGGNIVTGAFSPDGQTVLTAGEDGTARLWSATSVLALEQALPHDGPVLAIAFSPDGRRAATGDATGNVCVWDPARGTAAGKSLRHGSAVRALAFSPDGRGLLSGGDDGRTRLWDVAGGRAVATMAQHARPVRVLAFSPDGRTVLTGSDDGTARLSEALTGRALVKPLRHQAAVKAVAFSPDGKTILTGSEDHSARLWDAATGLEKAKLPHQHRVTAAVFRADGKLVLTASDDGTARLWTAGAGRPVGAPLRHQDALAVVLFAPDGQGVLTGAEDHTVRLWRYGDALHVAATRQPRSVVAVAFGADGRTVLTGSVDGLPRLWDWRQGTVRALPLQPEAVLAVACSPDGKTVLTGCWRNDKAVPPEIRTKTARLWDAATGRPTGVDLEHRSHVHAVAFSPDGRRLLTGCEDGVARLWQASDGRLLATLPGHERKVTAVAFSRDGTLAATGGWDNKVRVWRVPGGELVGQPLAHEDFVQTVAFGAGTILVTGGDDFTTRVWDGATGKPQGPPLRHPAKIQALAVSPDGRLLGVGCIDQTARLWELATGKPLGPPLRHDGRVVGVAFSPDGRLFATASWDQTARLWRVPSLRTETAERIELELQVQTGMALGTDGAVVPLSASAWRERHARLRAGGQ